MPSLYIHRRKARLEAHDDMLIAAAQQLAQQHGGLSTDYICDLREADYKFQYDKLAARSASLTPNEVLRIKRLRRILSDPVLRRRRELSSLSPLK